MSKVSKIEPAFIREARAKGLVPVQVLVPVRQVQTVKYIARALRQMCENQQITQEMRAENEFNSE